MLLSLLYLLIVSATANQQCDEGGKVWNECGSSCTATCQMSSPICTMNCVPKCECPQQAPIFHDGTCIAIRDCPNKRSECIGGRVWNDCALKCIRTCAKPNVPCVKMCVPRCACSSEVPIWHNNECISIEQCPQKKKPNKKIKTLWETAASLFGHGTDECTRGPHSKPCENGGTPTGNLGSCKCDCPKMTAGLNCEIQIAIGRPYTSGIKTNQKICQREDKKCLGHWLSSTLKPLDFKLVQPGQNNETQEFQHAIDEYILQGIAEHTSVASFGKVTMQLLRLNAPADLIERTLASAQDEIRHAQYMFSIVDQLSTVLGIGTTTVPGEFPFPNDRIEIATPLVTETLEEGVVGECTAAVRLCVRSKTTSNKKLALVLKEMAKDEARHAALAFRTVFWAIGVLDDARNATEKWLNSKVKEVASDLEDGVVLFTSSDCTVNMHCILSCFGLLKPKEMEWISVEIMSNVVKVWLRLLLDHASDWNEFVNAVKVRMTELDDGLIGSCVKDVVMPALLM